MVESRQSKVVAECIRNAPFIRRLALSLVSEADADDLAQDVMLAALRRPPRNQFALRGWLSQVARNMAFDRARSTHMRRHLERRDAETRTATDAEDGSEREHTAKHLRGALQSLSDGQQEVLILSFFDGLPPRKIAARLQLPIETVRSRKKRGLARLRELLDNEYGNDRNAWCLALVSLCSEFGKKGRALVAGGIAALVLLGFAVTLQVLSQKAPLDDETVADARPRTRIEGEDLPVADPPEDDSRINLPAGELSSVEEIVPTEDRAPRFLVETVDAAGVPVEAAVHVGVVGAGYDKVASTGTTGTVEIDVEEEFIGAIGAQGYEHAVALTIMAPGRQRAPIRVITPKPGVPTRVRFVLGPPTAAPLSGIVIDHSGLPIEGASVTVGNPGVVVSTHQDGSTVLEMPDTEITGPDGLVEFKGLTPGRRPVQVEHPSQATRWLQCDVPFDGQLVLRMDRGKRLTGTVRDESGAAVPGARIYCTWSDMLHSVQTAPSAEAIADEHGEFILEGVGRNGILLWAEHPERRDLQAHTELATSSKAHWDATLRERQAIHLRIDDPQGNPVEQAHAVFYSNTETAKWRGDAFSAADGTLTLYHWPDSPIFGFVTREVHTPSWPTVLTDIQPSPEIQVVQVTDGVPELVSFHGLIVSSKNRPLLGRTVLDLKLKPVYSRVFQVAATGEFSGELPAGSYSVTIHNDLHGATDLGTFELAAEHDLGSLEAPKLGRLNFDDAWAHGFEYELVQKKMSNGSAVNLRIASGIGPPPAHWDLFPGVYEFEVLDEELKVKEFFEVTVEAGGRVAVGK